MAPVRPEAASVWIISFIATMIATPTIMVAMIEKGQSAVCLNALGSGFEELPKQQVDGYIA
jgi:hypothetical protein